MVDCRNIRNGDTRLLNVIRSYKTSFTPDRLKEIIDSLIIRDQKQTTEDLSALRKQIDELDDQLLELLAKRMRVSREIGTFKKEHNMTVVQTNRYDEILTKRISQASEMGMNPEFMRIVLQAIHEESVRQQIDIFNE